VARASAVGVLEELLARQLLAPLDDAAQPPVLHADPVLLAALAAEGEHDRRALDGGVPVAEGGQAERPVVARVLLVAHADERGLEQADHGRHHLPPGQAAARQVFVRARADDGQRLAEGEHAAELGLVADGAPARVVPVLLAAARVAPRGLDVAERVATDPDAPPGGRDDQRLDARQRGAVAHRPAPRAEVPHAAPHSPAAQAGGGVGDVVQAGRAGGALRLRGELEDGLVEAGA